jgi:hypothetical protein
VARPSKLTDQQWEAIGKRLLNGESVSALARAFKVSKSAVSIRFSKRNETVRAAASKIVEAERALSYLNVSEQIAARTLADDLKAVSTQLAGAAKYGAMTAHRLAGIANQQVDKIDDNNPMESQEVLQGISALTKMANDSSAIGLNLLNANKKTLDDKPGEQSIRAVRIIRASA